jgi:hypothetical protein
MSMQKKKQLPKIANARLIYRRSEKEKKRKVLAVRKKR